MSFVSQFFPSSFDPVAHLELARNIFSSHLRMTLQSDPFKDFDMGRIYEHFSLIDTSGVSLVLKILSEYLVYGSLKMLWVSRSDVGNNCKTECNCFLLCLFSLDKRWTLRELRDGLAVGAIIRVKSWAKSSRVGESDVLFVKDPNCVEIDTCRGMRCSAAECDVRTTRICSRCHVLGYCGAKHQKSDWKWHKLVCKTVHNVKDGEKAIALAILQYERPIHKRSIFYKHPKIEIKKAVHGMGIFATESIPANTLLSVESPLFVDQKSDFSNTMSLLSSSLLSRHHTNMIKAMDLCSSIDWNCDSQHLSNLEKVFAGKFPGGHNRYTIARFLSILDCNKFSVNLSQSTSGDSFSSALYYHSSRYNHSCVPNACWITIGNVLLVYSTKELMRDNEILISYAYVGDYGTGMRKDFECHCNLCSLAGREDLIPRELKQFGITTFVFLFFALVTMTEFCAGV